MKRLLLFLSLCFICSAAIAHTINWYVDGSIYHTTTCESGDDVTPPTAPEKYGYTFNEWRPYLHRIEYLESTGSETIDTEFIPTLDIKIITEVTLLTMSGNGVCGNVWQAYTPTLIFIQGGGARWHLCESGSMESAPIAIGSTINIEATNGSLIINDTVYTSLKQTQSIPTSTFKVFFRPGRIQVKYFKIYDKNILVRDLIPVIDINGVPCMYDKVHGKLYYNSGSGNFLTGPIIGE